MCVGVTGKRMNLFFFNTPQNTHLQTKLDIPTNKHTSVFITILETVLGELQKRLSHFKGL